MPSITQLPSGKFYCQIRLKGHPPIYRTFGSVVDAQAWAAIKEHEIKSSPTNERSPTDFGEETLLSVGLRYCDTKLTGKPSEYETTMRVKRIAKHFPQPFVEINKWDVNAYRIERLRSVTTTTCRHELVLLNRLFKWVQREFLMEIDNPCQYVEFPRARKPRDKVVSQDELDSLLSALQPDMGRIVELAYETAMRRSELLRLTPRCVYPDKRILDVIDGKTGSRSVPLSTRAVELLRQAMSNCPTPDSRLFPFAPTSVTQALRRARKKLGLSDDIRFHQLRHSRISLVAKKGFNQAQIMMVSGHRDVRSVQRYTHLSVHDVIGLLD